MANEKNTRRTNKGSEIFSTEMKKLKCSTRTNR